MTKQITKFLPLSAFLVLAFHLVASEPTLRHFDREEMEQYTKSDDFSYMDYTVQPPSIWERIGWWFQEIFARLFSNPNTPLYMRVIYYLILFSIVGGTIFYMLKLRYGKALLPDARRFVGTTSGIAGVHQVVDYDPFLRQALQEENFKLAVRYLYLKSLVTLSNKKLIKLKESKTPYDYEHELKGSVSNSYHELAKLFEYVWYGDFDASEKDYTRGNDLYMQIEKAG